MPSALTEEEASNNLRNVCIGDGYYSILSSLDCTKHLEEILSNTYKVVIFFSRVGHNLHIEDA